MAAHAFAGEVHHTVPRCLLRLRDRAEAHEEFDGEGIQLWLDYEFEALRYGVDPDVSREELAALVKGSTVLLPREEHRAAHDTNYFVPLVQRTAEHFQLGDVTADKAYLSHKNLRAVELVGGTPFVPFKSNTVEPTEASIWSKMYHLFMHERETFLEHYHRRSNIESAYSMIKGKFGDSVRSKSDVGQINETLCKVLCHNICVLIQAIHELGIEPTFGAKPAFGAELAQALPEGVLVQNPDF